MRLLCSFKFEVRQNMMLTSNNLQRKRHFCFDANPYPTGRRGLRRNRNVWRAASSDLSHWQLESTAPKNASVLTGHLIIPRGGNSSANLLSSSGGLQSILEKCCGII